MSHWKPTCHFILICLSALKIGPFVCVYGLRNCMVFFPLLLKTQQFLFLFLWISTVCVNVSKNTRMWFHSNLSLCSQIGGFLCVYGLWNSKWLMDLLGFCLILCELADGFVLCWVFGKPCEQWEVKWKW